MKDLLACTPVLRHELRWGWRDHLWIAPLLAVAAAAISLAPMWPPVLTGIAFWILVFYVMTAFSFHFTSIRRRPGLDPAVGTCYPRWRIVLEQSAALWLWTLLLLLPAAVWEALGFRGFGVEWETCSFNGRHFALILLSLWCLGQMMLLAAAAGRARQKAPAILFLILLYFVMNLPFKLLLEQQDADDIFTILLVSEIVLALLAMLGHGAALMPPGANRALLLRPAVLLGAALIGAFKPGAETDVLAVAGCLILIAATGERWLPSRRQLALIDRHPWLKIPLFPFQSGFLPGLFTGGLVLGLTVKAEYWQRDIWIPLVLVALLLCWRRFTRLPIAAAAGLSLLLLLPLLLLFSESIPAIYARIALPAVTGAGLLALAPAALAYLKRYGTGNEDDDTL